MIPAVMAPTMTFFTVLLMFVFGPGFEGGGGSGLRFRPDRAFGQERRQRERRE
jgi:hypothetical protein